MDFPIQYYLQQEQEAIEKEALIQLEIRRQKYTSDEAIKRSRLAVQRRVAAKAERLAQKAKESEDAEAGKKEKMQQVNFILVDAMCSIIYFILSTSSLLSKVY